MSGSSVVELDSLRLNSPAAVATAVHDIYRELRRGRRVIARIGGPRWNQQATHWLGHALEQAGIAHELGALSATDAEPGSHELAVQLIASSEPTRSSCVGGFDRAAPLKIGLLGLGTVGLGVYRHLAARPDLFDVRRVVVRDPARHRDDGVPADRLSTNLWHAINEPADIVIELVGGIDAVSDVVHAALLRGRTVISANKALIATRWNLFERYARAPGPRLHFSAAVGGALPVLETIVRASRTSTIASVRAVINGTCNFVLDELAAGTSLSEAVALAQRHGFAEADPRADLSGTDAAQKLSLIAHAAFGLAPDPGRIACQGIESLTPAAIAAAVARGRVVRLVASCVNEQGMIRARVQPEELNAADYLAGARREENRVELLTTAGETLRLAGKGAGRWPTAVSVMGDVYALLESRAWRALPASINR
jgi:homoserine dehydrogenase